MIELTFLKELILIKQVHKKGVLSATISPLVFRKSQFQVSSAIVVMIY